MATNSLVKSAVFLAVLLLIAGLAALTYIHAGNSHEERLCRQRACYLCHAPGFTEPLDCLKQWRKGQRLAPLIQQRLEQEHPYLVGDAAAELADYITRQQLPALAASRSSERAESLYLAKCAACHGRQGEGSPEQYPPLSGSEWLTQEPSRLPEILSQGLREPITVKGEPWNSVMLPPGIRQEDQALLIPFLRQRFGSR